MIDWPEQDAADRLTRAFANLAAKAMASATGMRFRVREREGRFDIETDHPDAQVREFGDGKREPESWSVKGLFAAERTFNEHAPGGL